MVGVPRSKGCARCRQRRKGCDKRRPACGQCLAAGAQCYGYDRDRVFVNNFTPAVPDAKQVPARYSRAQIPNGDEDNFCVTGPLAQAWALRIDPAKAAQIGTPPNLLAGASTAQVTSRFLQDYLPSGQPEWTLDSWIEVIPAMKPSDRLAHEALKAIAVCTAGKKTNDAALMRKGFQLYGVALHYSTLALQHPVHSRSTAILAATKTFGMIEMLYGIDKANHHIHVESWVGHVDGQIAITMLQPPEAYQTGIAHRLFVGSRYAQLISCLQFRKRYLLNTREWRTVPWAVIPKSKKDCLVDILCDIVDLQVYIVELKSNPQNPPHGLSRDDLLERAHDLQNETQQWLLENSPLRVFQDEQGNLLPIRDQRDFALADVTLFYWTNQLLLCQLIRRLCPADSQGPPEANPSQYIRKLAFAIPCFLDRIAGIMGGHRVAWPLGMFQSIMMEPNDATPEDIATMTSVIHLPVVQAFLGKFLAGLAMTRR